MGEVVELKPTRLEDNLEFVADCCRFAEKILSEANMKRKYGFADSVWENLGSNATLLAAVEDEKIRRIRSGQQKRERAQALIVKGPDILDSIASDVSASPRHRVDALRTLDGMTNGPGDTAPASDRFQITIVLNADDPSAPHTLHFDKSIKPDPPRYRSPSHSTPRRGKCLRQSQQRKRMTAVANLFEQLRTTTAGQEDDRAAAQERRSRRTMEKKTEVEAFLLNILADGPMPAAIIEELGAARKFSKMQLWCAKQRIGAVTFKKKGKFDGGWICSLPQNAPKPANTANPSYTRALRNLAKSQGFRLRPIGKTAGNRPYGRGIREDLIEVKTTTKE